MLTRETSTDSDSLQTLPARQKRLVRDLAKRVHAAACREEMTAIKQRWCDVNALRKPDRAPVWFRPVGCWGELIPEEDLQCTDPWLRSLEYRFRQDLFKIHAGDDTPLEETFDVQASITVEPADTWGVEIVKHRPAEADGAWQLVPPLQTEEDFDNLAVPTYALDRERTDRDLNRLGDLLNDVYPVRLVCNPGFDSATIGTAAVELRGLERMMLDMVLQPELLHRLMAHIRDAKLRRLDAMESSGLLTPNNRQPMLECDLPGPAPTDGKYTLANCITAGNSQEFDQVSPEMFDEFCLNYQKPIFERFAWSCYGCCENLTKKIDQVLSINNLRIFVCSAWTDLAKLQEAVGTNYCIMWRQKATDVVFPDDSETIRRDLMEGAKRLRGYYYQIVLRELQTLRSHMDRLQVWTRHAIEAAERYC
ncbi:MAG: hypothetical protein JXA11_12030 [Phycisphaerae bacterium]|nr:hypothetical protein [Phycisphaerae bacterium]